MDHDQAPLPDALVGHRLNRYGFTPIARDGAPTNEPGRCSVMARSAPTFWSPQGWTSVVLLALCCPGPATDGRTRGTRCQSRRPCGRLPEGVRICCPCRGDNLVVPAWPLGPANICFHPGLGARHQHLGRVPLHSLPGGRRERSDCSGCGGGTTLARRPPPDPTDAPAEVSSRPGSRCVPRSHRSRTFEGPIQRLSIDTSTQSMSPRLKRQPGPSAASRCPPRYLDRCNDPLHSMDISAAGCCLRPRRTRSARGPGRVPWVGEHCG